MPLYEHDCENCVFLGQTIGGGRISDLYFCPTEPFEGSVIARFSSEGSDYESCPWHLARPEGYAELWVARTLAEQRGLTRKE